MDKSKLTFKQFKALASQGCKTIPVYKKVLSDMLTPVSAWMHLSQNVKYAFFLESVEKGSQYSRFSYVGINPQKIITNKNNKTYIDEGGKTFKIGINFLDLLRDIQSKYNTVKLEEMPPFTGGLVGYFGYETVKWTENVPTHNESKIDIPDSIFMLFEDLIAFDHLKGTALVISNINIKNDIDIEKQFNQAHLRVDTMGELLHSDIEYQTPIKMNRSPTISNFDKRSFISAVKKIKKHIIKGDVFQLVLSQRFERKTDVDPTVLYRALRTINPSPYMFHLKVKDFDIIGASPELLVKVEDRTVEIRPIAGTRKRGKNSKEDEQLALELINDEKEKAEHLMLLALGRNDVGRVSKYGSVKIPEYMVVEKYSHVMHIVSDVKGELLDNKDSFDALMSGFPAGTVTGAPKIRAMEIINSLEPDRRDIYSGAVGFFDFRGNMNTCICIRTMVVKNGCAFFQSGAGIVHDSDPSKEYYETINKSQAIVDAINFAEDGLMT